MNLSNLLRAFAILFFYGVQMSLPAQDAPVVSTEFTVLAYRGAPEGLQYLPSASDEGVELQFNTHYRSEKYDYSGPRQITFFRTELVPGDARPRRIPVTTAEFTHGGGPWLVLFFRTANGSWQARAIPDSLDRLAADSMAIYNGTGVPLMAKVGEEVIRLEPGLSEQISTELYQNQKVEVQYTEEVNGRDVQRTMETINRAIPLLIVYRDEEKVTKLHETRLVVNPGERNLWIFLPPERPGSKRFRTKNVVEVVQQNTVTSE